MVKRAEVDPVFRVRRPGGSWAPSTKTGEFMRIQDDESQEERFLLDQIAELQRLHNQQLQPYIQRLAAIKNMRLPSFLVSGDELLALHGMDAMFPKLDSGTSPISK